MTVRNRSVPVDIVLPHVNYQNLGQAIAWLTKVFGFREYYRYGDGPSGGQMWAGRAAIQVRQAGDGEKSPAQLGYGTQSLTVFVEEVDEHYKHARAAAGNFQYDERVTTLNELWDEHTACEFTRRDTEATLATMVHDAYVNHIPVMTGGYGKAELRRFYSREFIPKMPPDTKLVPVSRTVGSDQLVDEMIFSFTHSEEMPWMLPGVAPTNKHVEVPLVAIVHFRDGKLAHEHIYWDQASVLKQIGLITDPSLPVFGAETAQKVLTGSG